MSKPPKRGGKAPDRSDAAAATSRASSQQPPPTPSSSSGGPSRTSTPGSASTDPHDMYAAVAGGRAVSQAHVAIPTPCLSRPPLRAPSPTSSPGRVQSEPPLDRLLTPPPGECRTFPLAPDISMRSPAASADDDDEEGEDEEEMEPKVLQAIDWLGDAHRVLSESDGASIPEATHFKIAHALTALFNHVTDSHWATERIADHTGDTLYDHMERRFDVTPPATDLDAQTICQASSVPSTSPPPSAEGTRQGVNPWTGLSDAEMQQGIKDAWMASALFEGVQHSAAPTTQPSNWTLRSNLPAGSRHALLGAPAVSVGDDPRNWTQPSQWTQSTCPPPSVHSADVPMAPPTGPHYHSTHALPPALHRHRERAATIVPPAPAQVEQGGHHEASEPVMPSSRKGKQREDPIYIPKGMSMRVCSEDRGEQRPGFIPGKSFAFPSKPVKQCSYISKPDYKVEQPCTTPHNPSQPLTTLHNPLKRENAATSISFSGNLGLEEVRKLAKSERQPPKTFKNLENVCTKM